MRWNDQQLVKQTLPNLPLEEWEAAKDTLQLYVQIVGKIKLALMSYRNHWWHIPLYISSRGFTTSPIPYGYGNFEIEFNFWSHRLIITTSEGEERSIALEKGLSVAEFYKSLFTHLADLGIVACIRAVPYDVKSTIPFAKDTFHKDYDKEYVERFWKILVWSDIVFKKFSGRFSGKISPVHLFWHSFDLAVTRFSGKRGPELKEGSMVGREAYSHEVISFGFWAGDTEFREPAFYSYTYPAPNALNQTKLTPAEAFWMERNGSPLAIYKYADLLEANDPEEKLVDFLESAYVNGAQFAGWDMEYFKTGG